MENSGCHLKIKSRYTRQSGSNENGKIDHSV